MSMDWYMRVNGILDGMAAKARDAYHKVEFEPEVAKQINSYLEQDYDHLKEVWAEKMMDEEVDGNLRRHIRFGAKVDYVDILSDDLRRVAARARERIAKSAQTDIPQHGFEDLLHPIITAHALPLFATGHLREAVHTAITAIFDLIRLRTGIDADGARLVGEVFSVENPRLIFSELRTESGKNDQKGFMQLLQGAYLGIRNPKAHSLIHDLNERKAAEYLVFASLLARRVEEANEPSE